MNSLNRIQIPQSLIDLVRKEVTKGLDAAQDEVANTIHAMNNGQYSKIGLDLAINHLRGVRDYMSFLKAIDDSFTTEEDPDDNL